MEVSRIRALRGPNLWSRHTAIEAIVCCTEDERNIDTCRASRTVCASASPNWPCCGRSVMMKRYRWPRRWSSPRSACRRRRAARSLSAARRRPLKRAPIRWSSNTAKRRLAAWPSNSPRISASGGRRHAFRTRRGARPSARTRRGRAPGPEHRGHRLCGGGAQHPLPPADRREHGAVRLGQPAAAHPGGRNRSHQRRRRIDRPGQGTEQDPAARGRRSGSHGRPVLSAEDAWAAACEIGGPVVVKPQDGNQGKGVAVNLAPASRSKPPTRSPSKSATKCSSSVTSRATTTACWWSATS
jgi:cyanophycin synthetase